MISIRLTFLLVAFGVVLLASSSDAGKRRPPPEFIEESEEDSRPSRLERQMGDGDYDWTSGEWPERMRRPKSQSKRHRGTLSRRDWQHITPSPS